MVCAYARARARVCVCVCVCVCEAAQSLKSRQNTMHSSTEERVLETLRRSCSSLSQSESLRRLPPAMPWHRFYIKTTIAYPSLMDHLGREKTVEQIKKHSE